MSLPFELVGAPLELPYMCVCGRGRGPFVRTRIPAPTSGDVFVCADCVRRIVELYELVPAADHAALREQLASADAQVMELSAALDKARKDVDGLEAELAAGELEGLRAERAAVNAEMQRLARENVELRNGALEVYTKVMERKRDTGERMDALVRGLIGQQRAARTLRRFLPRR